MKRSGKKGFTLIELIIVIAILAILAVVIIPKILGVKGDAQVGVNRTNANEVKSALAQYYAANDTFPAQQHDYEQVLTKKMGKIPAYKNGTPMGAYVAGHTVGSNFTSYSITFGEDTGTETTEAGTKMYDDTDTNKLWK